MLKGNYFSIFDDKYYLSIKTCSSVELVLI